MIPPPSPEEVSFGHLDDVLGFRLQRLWGLIQPQVARAMGKHKLGRGTFTILALVDANPGLTQTTLAREAVMDKGQLVAVLHTLQEQGLLERRAGVGDRRQNRLFLTQEGTSMTQQMSKTIHATEAAVKDAMSPAAYSRLLSAMDTATQALRPDRNVKRQPKRPRQN